jgi:TRAP-type mannitol/chloroaromatic compound transport system permease small subunit
VPRFVAFVEALNEWVGRIVGFQIVFIVGVVIYEVVMRSAFGSPTLWANETTIYVTAMAYLLGGGYALLHRRHVIVDVVYQRLSPGVRARLDRITLVFFLVYVLTLIWVGWEFAWDSLKIRETVGSPWNPPIYPVKLSIPVAGTLLLFQGIANAIRDAVVVREESRS